MLGLEDIVRRVVKMRLEHERVVLGEVDMAADTVETQLE